MRAPSLVESLHARHLAGLPFLPISGGDGSNDPPPAVPDLNKLVEAVLAKTGDPNAALKSLVAENYSLRDDLKTARSKLPGDGAIVLLGDDAKDWGAYRGIGKPSELRKTVEEHGQLTAKVGTFERNETLRSIAEKTGTKFAVLAKLAGPDLVFGETKVKGKDGKETTVVTVKDGEADAVPFDAYAGDKWAEFLPSLKPDGKAIDVKRPPGTPSRQERHVHEPPNKPEPDTIRAKLLASGVGSY